MLKGSSSADSGFTPVASLAPPPSARKFKRRFLSMSGKKDDCQMTISTQKKIIAKKILSLFVEYKNHIMALSMKQKLLRMIKRVDPDQVDHLIIAEC